MSKKNIKAPRIIQKIQWNLLIVFSLLVTTTIAVTFMLIKHKGQLSTNNDVTNINKSDVIFDTNKQLKYFYEPAADTALSYGPEWLGHTVINTINKDSLNERYNYPVEKKTDHCCYDGSQLSSDCS